MSADTNVQDPAAQGNTNADGAGDSPPAQNDAGAQATPPPAEGSDAPATGGDAPPATTPVEYEEFEVAEDVHVDTGIVGEFKETAKGMGLSQENAQKLVDLATRNAHVQQEAVARQWGEVRENWVNELKADHEFGQQNFDSTVERANRALRKFDEGGELAKYISSTGLGDYPPLIKMLARIDKRTGEDSVDAQSSTPAQGLEDDAAIFYPNQGKQ